MNIKKIILLSLIINPLLSSLKAVSKPMDEQEWANELSIALSPDATHVGIMPNGQTFIGQDDNNGLFIRDASSGTELMNRHFNRDIRKMAVFHDGKKVVLNLSYKPELTIYDLEAGAPVLTIHNVIPEDEPCLRGLALFPDGKKLIAITRLNAKMLDCQTGKELQRIDFNYDVADVDVFPDGSKVLVVTLNRSEDQRQVARIWDVARKSQLHAFHHNRPIRDAKAFPDCNKVVTASGKSVKLWDLISHQTQDPKVMHHTNFAQSVSVFPDGKKILSGSADKTVKIWNAQTQEELASLSSPDDRRVEWVGVFPHGEKIAALTRGDRDEKTLHIWKQKN